MKNQVAVTGVYMGSRSGVAKKTGNEYHIHNFACLGLNLELFDLPNGIKPEPGKQYEFTGTLGNGNRGGVSFNVVSAKLA